MTQIWTQKLRIPTSMNQNTYFSNIKITQIILQEYLQKLSLYALILFHPEYFDTSVLQKAKSIYLKSDYFPISLQKQQNCMNQANNNLEIFRRQVKNFFADSYQNENQHTDAQITIHNYQQLKDLVNHLCDQKLLHPAQVKKLITKIQPADDKVQNNLLSKVISSLGPQEAAVAEKISDSKTKTKVVSFPLSIQEFQNIIMVQFGDENCRNLMTDLGKFKNLLKKIKGVLNVWKDKGLTNQQKSQLESIFAKGNQKISIFCEQLNKKKQILQNISEQQIHMIKSLDEWIQMQKITQKFQDYEDFQKHNQQLINDIFNKNQVKQAHFKKKQYNSKISLQISKVKAFNSKNDEPIEAVLIAKNSINFSKINKELLKFDALKQLCLSAYFPNFLGFNTHSSPTTIQYFVQTFDGKNLDILMKSQNALDLQSPLLKHWMYQIYKAFYDILLMCSYEPELPIKVQDFQVKDCGLQLVLKNISFSQKRKKTNLKIDPLQTKLLHNLGTILLDLLKIKPLCSQIDKKLNRLEQRCFFKGLLNVCQSHKNFQESIVQNRLLFFNLQTHPLLEESLFSEGIFIIENYIALFGSE